MLKIFNGESIGISSEAWRPNANAMWDGMRSFLTWTKVNLDKTLSEGWMMSLIYLSWKAFLNNYSDAGARALSNFSGSRNILAGSEAMYFGARRHLPRRIALFVRSLVTFFAPSSSGVLDAAWAPEGPPTRSWGPEGPLTCSVFIIVKVVNNHWLCLLRLNWMENKLTVEWEKLNLLWKIARSREEEIWRKWTFHLESEKVPDDEISDNWEEN